MVARYPYPAKAETGARFESVYPLRATRPTKWGVARAQLQGWEMTFKGSDAGRSGPATSPEATGEPKGAAKRFRIWVIASSSIFLVVVLSVAVALAIQKHNDRVLD